MRAVGTFAALLLVSMPTIALADQGALGVNAINSPSVPGITVTATASVPFTPDIAVFDIPITSTAKTAAAAQAAMRTQGQRLIAVLRKAGVLQTDVQSGSQQLSNNVTSFVKVAADWQGTQTFVAQTAADKAGSVADALSQDGFGKTFTVVFDTTKRDELYQTALAQAMTHAQLTANTIAQAAHVEILKLQSADASAAPDILRIEQKALEQVQAGNAFSMFLGASQKGTITATVQVTYLIK